HLAQRAGGPVGAGVPAEPEQDDGEDDGEDRPAGTPDEDERMLLGAVRDPLPRRQQPVGVGHVAGASLSSPWVRPTVDVADALPGQMRVELRGGDTGMSEQLLD